MADQFPPVTARWQIEQAVLAALQAPPVDTVTASRLIYYLAEAERQLGLAAKTVPVPPGPDSFRGGYDALTLQAEWMPMIHAIIGPDGDAERLDVRTFAQRYTVTLVATVGDDNEDTARMYADAYGHALTALILGFGTLGIAATETRLGRSASVESLDATGARQVLRSTVQFQTLIAPAALMLTPTVWAADPYGTPAPPFDVTSTDVTVQAVAAGQPV